MKKVLFVCLGNICRSPMAEAVFKDFLIKMGRSDEFIIKSCGSGSWHIGQNADPRTLKCLNDNGLNFQHLVSQINTQDLLDYDYLVAMDKNNYRDLQDMVSESDNNLKEKIIMFRSFDGGSDSDVPDPYYGDEQGFQEVFEIVSNGCPGLLNYIDQNASNSTESEQRNL